MNSFLQDCSIRTEFPDVEKYMHSCMTDSAHDLEHVYRVLNYALDISKHERDVDAKLLVTACLLHDIARVEQFANPNIDHALLGAEKAFAWLIENSYSHDFAANVSSCIKSHRYRSDNPPLSLEAKILFDADKLDVCGAVGIARTLLYRAYVSEPLYSLTEKGRVLDGSNDSQPSFLREYKFKLENIYDRFYTKRGLELALKRKNAAKHFYDSLLAEVRECYSVFDPDASEMLTAPQV